MRKRRGLRKQTICTLLRFDGVRWWRSDYFYAQRRLKIKKLIVFQSYLTHRFPTELYSMVAAGAKVAHFSVCGEIARDLEIVLCCGW